MSQPTRGLRLIVFAALVLGILAALGAGAAPESTAGGLKIAIVDVNRLLSDYNGTIASNNQLRKMADDAQTVLQTWKQNFLLTEPEQKRLGELTLKEATLTEAEKAEKKRLLDRSAALFQEFTTLQTKSTGVTDTEKQRITELTKLAGDTDNRIAARTKELQDEFEKERTTNATKIVKEIRDAVAKVAKKEGVNLVLSNDTAWYAEADITDAVLKQLNGK
ncbi:MAG TPA: OmpH family outer membrane protein [Chthonomonadaceae bacterium]|nr:OmpH family outer membrane protein [Chthonomonadaceae bacterium]